MDSKDIWSADDAQQEFDRVLEQARNVGPQEIDDPTGIYVLKVKLDRTRPDAAQFLAKRAPKS
ncbi:hypothetical protein E0H36_18610 [Rhizobium leguminosarum bv. viciae]|uniref:hypothetical protein n=1 Tax=Rhizobium leguminosarum TaxID=384 RepID=UPI0010315B36|nr:hypothetical protein [Rhizobium leguminosarum]MBY5485184.1 hypothetical protein [Rhizobium leguminosarum]TAY88121.1 hypothetical protein ELH83_09975 [Rhizobium leguminosarum]TBZ31253.1 hypothetical protein E0H36_18610 [Rhizobium leguminosarum bv. viciae]